MSVLPTSPTQAAATSSPAHPQRITRPGGLLLGAIGLGAAVLIGWWTTTGRPATEGAALFDGRRPLQARIHGHAEPLPAAAATCSNCHATAAVRAAAAGAGLDTTSFGPVLDRATLTRPQPRRGGPASRYDAATLCRLLRDGIDPAWVTLPRSMPRYLVSDADCQALWAHLSRS